jgi:hypothetical protein
MNQKVTVMEVFQAGVPWRIFRRAMVGELREQWMQMQRMLEQIDLTHEPDNLVWTVTEPGIFSVNYFHSAMQFSRVVPYKFMWKTKIPLWVKTFLWLVLKGSILTRDVLSHRRGNCEKKCSFYEWINITSLFLMPTGQICLECH